MTDYFGGADLTGWGGPQQNIFATAVQTPEAVDAWQQQFWMPHIATGGYIPVQYDNADAMATLGQTDAWNQRQTYLNQLGAQRIATLQEGMQDSRNGGIASQAYALAGMLGGTLGGVLGGTASGAGATAATAGDGLAPILAGNGNPLATALPGGISSVNAAGTAAWGAGAAVPALSQLPSAIATPDAINTFTGTTPSIPTPVTNTTPNTTNTGNMPNTQTPTGGAPSWLPLLGDLLGGLAGINAGNNAADAISDASDKQLEFARESRDKAIEMNQPWFDAGKTALDRMLGMTGMGGTPVDQNALLNNDPSYQFRQNESMRMLEGGAAARGGLLSGDFGRNALQLAGQYASQEYSNIYNRIAQIAGYGQGASANNQNALTNYAQGAGNAVMNQGMGNASGYVAQGNILMDLASRMGDFDWNSIGRGR